MKIFIVTLLLITATACAKRNDGMGSLWKGVGCFEGTIECP